MRREFRRSDAAVLLEVALDHLCDLVAQPHGVVRAAVLGIDLAGIRQVESRKRRTVVRDALAVVERDDGLRCAFAENPVAADPAAVEVLVDLARDEGGDSRSPRLRAS